MGKQIILFGTSNQHKLKEARAILESEKYSIKHYEIDLLEIQDNSLEKIAYHSLINLPEMDFPIFVEDTGLFIKKLNGFPGPYASQTFKSIGNEGILKLMKDENDRDAYFESYIAFKDTHGEIKTFQGICKGQIAKKNQGTEWGFDPIFIPISQKYNPNHLTFSQLGEETKNLLSHRSQALQNLKVFL